MKQENMSRKQPSDNRNNANMNNEHSNIPVEHVHPARLDGDPERLLPLLVGEAPLEHLVHDRLLLGQHLRGDDGAAAAVGLPLLAVRIDAFGWYEKQDLS